VNGPSRLRALIKSSASTREPEDAGEQCDLCAAAVAAEHRHVLERSTNQMLCTCRPCSLLFDHDAAGGDRYRLVPERRQPVDVDIDEAAWGSLRIPVELAFFVRNNDGTIRAYYPSPAGRIESTLPLDSWSEIEAANPSLQTLQPEVEALLVNRVTRPARYWMTGIDACYRLVALFREHWSGIGGGDAVRREVERFFDELASRRGARVRSST
jgi:hypothetical protein